MTSAVARALWRPVNGIILRIALATSPSQQVGSLQVVDFTSRSSKTIDPALVDRIQAAVGLISERHPAWAAHMERLVRRILVTGRGSPMWIPSVRAILLRDEYLIGSPPEWIALTLVHETMHARLWRRGFKYPPHQRRRIERICTRAEVAFAKRLPRSDELVEMTMAKLETEWWTRRR